MASCSLATFITLEDIEHAEADSEHETLVLKLISDARAKGYDSVFLPLTTDKWRQRWAGMCLAEGVDGEEWNEHAHAHAHGHGEGKDMAAEAWRVRPAFLHDEVTITRLDEAEGITAVISEWLELDAADDWVRHDAEIALRQELAYASYLGIRSAILPVPRQREHVASYARIVNSCLKNTPYIYLSVRLPIYDPSLFSPGPSASPLLSFSSPPWSPSASIQPGTPKRSPEPTRMPAVMVSDTSSQRMPTTSEGELNATWEMWDLIRSMCDYNTRLTLTLDLSPALPHTLGVLSKWAAESVRNIFLPSSTFIANMKGYPVLPKPTQNFIRDNMIHRPTVILSEAASGKHARGGESAYSQYVRHLERTSSAVQAALRPGTVENFAQGYQDYLQAPLQPLMDNLQSVTYQTFEQDPVKYRQYEEAIYRALLDWHGDGKVVFCVAGAGRGPLVARCLTAIERAHREAVVYAVEKNPNAYVTLQHRQQSEWGNAVILLFGDMRSIEIPEQADILVSELLGSFGDNELSPECLDGAMRFLKPDGISIPSSYSAHLAPLSSSKLYNEARASKSEKSLETPYVVMFEAVNILSGDRENSVGNRTPCGSQIQECWEFEHPRGERPVVDARGLPLTNSHNARSATLRFWIPHAGVLHGLAGYFEAVLYGHVGISIHPHRKDKVSKDMLSWFPLFFPFKEPLYLPSNSELQVSIWRLTNQRQVWYEWHAESFLSVPTKNGNSVCNDSSGMQSSGSFAASSLRAPSPLADSADTSMSEHNVRTADADGAELGYEMVKIGHTSLHNPNGRSSWIGL